MAISAFLLVVLASTISLVVRASERSVADADDLEIAIRAISAAARDIEGIVPLRWAGDGAGFVFSGSSTKLTFATSEGAGGSPQLIVLDSMASAPGGLVRAAAILPPDAGSASGLIFGPVTDLYRGKYLTMFAFYDRLDSGQEVLVDDWTRVDRLPAAVRIALVDEQTKRVRFSERVPTHVDAEAGCASPGRGLCSYLSKNADGILVDAGGNLADEGAIDADDPLGWQRYFRK